LSPLVGTPLTTSAKFAVVAKSPLTQRLNDALSSSHFALAAKRAGFDALVLVGACERPSVLVIDDDRMRLEPAADLWGMSAQAAALSGEELNEARRVARRSCAACTIGCEHIYETGGQGVRLEYESLFALGPLCGVGDKDTVLRAAQLCDHFGLDTISTGA